MPSRLVIGIAWISLEMRYIFAGHEESEKKVAQARRERRVLGLESWVCFLPS